jgi:hypothetical protein
MTTVRRLHALFAIALFSGGPSFLAQAPRPVTNEIKPSESEHTKGPHGLEGWTLEQPVPESNYGDERFAFTLVLARNGKILRHVEGSPIIWKWAFSSDGREVAYETGPFHFSMICYLIDTDSGRRLADYDCFTYPGSTPDWVIALEKTP